MSTGLKICAYADSLSVLNNLIVTDVLTESFIVCILVILPWSKITLQSNVDGWIPCRGNQ